MLLNRLKIAEIGKPLTILARISSAYFISYYEKINSPYYLNVEHKPSNSLRFENEGLEMKTFIYPSFLVGQNSEQGAKNKYFVGAGRVMSLTFLDTNEEIDPVQKWEQRRICPFNFWQSMQLLKLGPRKQSKLQLLFVPETQESNYSYQYLLDYQPQKQEVNLSLEHFIKQPDGTKNNLWDIYFSLKYIEYLTLTQWIRSSIYYTSGMALMLQNQKKKELLRLELDGRNKETH